MQTPISNVLFLASYIRSRSPSALSVSPETAVPAQPTLRKPCRSRLPRKSSLAIAPDDELVERLALGDLEAAGVLRTRYAGRMRRAATSILGDEREAARAVEVALEEACSGWPPERGQVDRWLLRLVRRAAVARRRALWGLDSSDAPVSRRRPSHYLPSARH
jgi:hypothetical protein